MRRALIVCTAISVLGVGSAFLDYGLRRGLLWREAGGGLAGEMARLAWASLDAARGGVDGIAAETPASSAPAELVQHAADAEPHQIFTASMTAMDPQFPSVEVFHQEVNRQLKGDRLISPELSVAKLNLPEPQAIEEGASAALFLLSPSISEPSLMSAPALAFAPAPAPSAPPAPVLAANVAIAAGPLSSSAQASAMQPPVKNPFVASAASAASVPSSKISWNDLIRMASMKGGDGEEPTKIFGALSEKEFRAREVRCMATAIYFEARGESTRGQIAVGQVIMNRVRSSFYPNTICGVVFQGQWNRNACQFSFACDGNTDAPKETEQWKAALDVAKQVISGKVYLTDIADATHYHAVYVRPDWRRDVRRIKQIGVHIFYKAPFVTPLALDPDYQQL
jgi:spore germination cell wall hydrolase CwlJ-like protein